MNDLFLLAKACAHNAKEIQSLLMNGVSSEARNLLAEGFLVPAPQALAHAAGVFGAIGEMPGGGAALSEETSAQRLDLICAYASALQGMEREVDLQWSSHWSMYLESPIKAENDDAIAGLMEWNAGRQSELLEQMRASVKEHRAEEIWNR